MGHFADPKWPQRSPPGNPVAAPWKLSTRFTRRLHYLLASQVVLASPRVRLDSNSRFPSSRYHLRGAPAAAAAAAGASGSAAAASGSARHRVATGSPLDRRSAVSLQAALEGRSGFLGGGGGGGDLGRGGGLSGGAEDGGGGGGGGHLRQGSVKSANNVEMAELFRSVQ